MSRCLIHRSHHATPRRAATNTHREGIHTHTHIQIREFQHGDSSAASTSHGVWEQQSRHPVVASGTLATASATRDTTTRIQQHSTYYKGAAVSVD